jgi:putative transcriptional regulator
MGTYHSGYLEGQLLVATPNITGSSFKQSVILICAHSGEGAMGLIINHTLDSVHYDELFTQLNISRANLRQELPIHYGGPVEINRGFVVFEHKGRFLDEAMITVGDIAISGSLNLLRNIAEGTGPEKRLLALGYAGWSPGQLEEEIENNSWISVPVDNAIVFDNNNMNKWQRAALTHGIDLNKFSTTAGHA